MKEYEVLIESIEPCGGEEHRKSELIDVMADSPEAYVQENAHWPVIDITHALNGDTVIVTGDGRGYIQRYTFTE